MKYLILLKKVMPAALLLALLIIVVVSCKKKDEDMPAVPSGPVVPATPATPATFENKPLHMMSDYELTNHLEFPGHLINKIGKGLVGGEGPGILDPLKELGGTLWDVYNYISTGKQYSTIDDGLSQIQKQITTLQSTVNNLSNQIGISNSEIQSLLITTTLNEYITDIQTAMDSTSINGLQYYPRRAAQYKSGTLPMSEFSQDTMNLRLFAYDIYHPQPGSGVQNWCAQLNALLCPSNGPSGLMPLTNLIIQKATSGNLTDSAFKMTAYTLLEGYFMQVINSQFQCAILWSNAYDYYNPQDSLTPSWWLTETFTSQITQEIAGFLKATDYLIINIDDYRTQGRFTHDMQYANAGLAPDLVSVHALARSQFIANVLYGALGLSYPVMCGYVVTPKTYGSIGSAALSISIGSMTKDTVPTVIQAQIPYTTWSAANPPVCNPDNSWNIYRFGTLGKSDGTWPSGTATTINVPDNGNSSSPWVHVVPITGNITPLWYNPQFPNQTSPTKTTACTMQFAYFSVGWKWGFLELSNSPLNMPTDWNYTNLDNNILATGFFNFMPYNSHLGENQASLPCAATSNGSGKLYYETSGIYWKNTYGTAGTMQSYGSSSFTSNYYVIVDGVYINVTTGSGLPPNSGGIQAWAWYNVNYTMKGSGGDDLTVSIGTTRPWTWWPYEGDYQYSTAGDVVGTNLHDQAGSTWNSGFGQNTSLKANTQYQPGVQYYYQTANLPSVVNENITFVTGYQFVYMGTYPLPN